MQRTLETNKPNHQYIFLFVLLGLLILRIPFLGGMGFFSIQWEWTDTVFQIGTYLLTTFLIWWEADHLAEYHIDTLAVILIALCTPLQTLILMFWGGGEGLLTFPSTPSLLIWLIALVFAAGMWRKRSILPRIQPISWRWFWIGTLAGLFTAVVLSFPMSLQISDAELSRGLSPLRAAMILLVQTLFEFPYQIGYAAALEEPLFRGFLWGWLKQLRWPETRIWLFQAVLFMFSHIYYISKNPISFWIIVPVGALVFGFLAWRSRTITSSMTAHAMLNATTYGFGYLIALYRLG